MAGCTDCTCDIVYHLNSAGEEADDSSGSSDPEYWSEIEETEDTWWLPVFERQFRELGIDDVETSDSEVSDCSTDPEEGARLQEQREEIARLEEQLAHARQVRQQMWERHALFEEIAEDMLGDLQDDEDGYEGEREDADE